MEIIASHDRTRLAAETGYHVATVTDWAKGRKVASGTAYALRAAARRLDVALPVELRGPEDAAAEGAELGAAAPRAGEP